MIVIIIIIMLLFLSWIGEKPDLAKVFKETIPISAEWKNLGTLLNIPSNILDEIAANETEARGRLRQMLIEWLKLINPQPSWGQLIDALEPLNQTKAAELRSRCANTWIVMPSVSS